MATAKLVPSYERFLDRVVETMTPEEILAFRVSEEEEERAAELLDKNNAGELTLEERAELEQMVEFEEFMALIKIRASRRIRMTHQV